jgi:hypothetical protein
MNDTTNEIQKNTYTTNEIQKKTPTRLLCEADALRVKPSVAAVAADHKHAVHPRTLA